MKMACVSNTAWLSEETVVSSRPVGRLYASVATLATMVVIFFVGISRGAGMVS